MLITMLEIYQLERTGTSFIPLLSKLFSTKGVGRKACPPKKTFIKFGDALLPFGPWDKPEENVLV